jgi:hypothetical protein
MEKLYIEPKNLRSWWHFVKPGLEDVLKKSPENWIPEDVYADCMNGKVMLWVFSENNYPVGFAVLAVRSDALHCWCGWANSVGHFKSAVECVSEIAKAGGSKFVTFESWRSGWERLAPKFGFKPRTWVKEIL